MIALYLPSSLTPSLIFLGKSCDRFVDWYLANIIGATCNGGLPIFTVISVILLHQRLPIVSGKVLAQEVVHEAIAAPYR